MFDLYREQILERSQQPLFKGSISNPTHTADGENRSCGDEVHIEARLENGVITSIRHTCRSCAICAASADLLCEALEGKSTEHVSHITTEKITEMLGIPLSPIRLKCALLALETLKQALE